MKKIFVFISVFFLNLNTLLAELEMMPLEKYLTINDIESDTTYKYYFYTRCASIFYYLGDTMKDPKMDPYKEKYLNASSLFFNRALEFSSQHDKQKKQDSTKYHFLEIATYYAESGLESFQKTGKRLTDLMLSDVKTCKLFLN